MDNPGLSHLKILNVVTPALGVSAAPGQLVGYLLWRVTILDLGFHIGLFLIQVLG